MKENDNVSSLSMKPLWNLTPFLCHVPLSKSVYLHIHFSLIDHSTAKLFPLSLAAVIQVKIPRVCPYGCAPLFCASALPSFPHFTKYIPLSLCKRGEYCRWILQALEGLPVQWLMGSVWETGKPSLEGIRLNSLSSARIGRVQSVLLYTMHRVKTSGCPLSLLTSIYSLGNTLHGLSTPHRAHDGK